MDRLYWQLKIYFFILVPSADEGRFASAEEFVLASIIEKY